jgi:hypothetical protein
VPELAHPGIIIIIIIIIIMRSDFWTHREEASSDGFSGNSNITLGNTEFLGIVHHLVF